MNKVGQYTITGVNTIAQYGAIYAMEHYPRRDDIIEINRNRLMFMKRGLEELGFKVINPEGAFYIFVDYRMLVI